MYFNEDIDTVLSNLGVTKKGLDSVDAQKRLDKYGKNKLKEGKKKTVFQLFVEQLNDPLIYVLTVAAILSVVFMHEISDAIIIMLVVILNAVIGVSQEIKAEKSLEALNKLSSPKSYVLRDGEVVEIDSENLVVGDIVVLDTGRYISADIRLIESANLQIDESALTGESVPVNKDANKIIDENAPLGDRINMAFSSTYITNGRGLGVVTQTGMDTQIGQIAGMLDVKEEKTPLQKKLAEIGNLLGGMALVICVLMFLIAIFQKRDILEMFMTSISLAVAAIPEGMPAIVSIVLAMGVKKMVAKKAIVKKLPAVETLGSVNVICSDKTGTLTQNKMTVKRFYVNDTVYTDEEFEKVKLNETCLELINGIVLCNDATKTTGDPTEIALIDVCDRYGYKLEDIQSHKRVDEMPFDSDRKLMSTVNEINGKNIVYTKGAIDNILKLAVKVNINGEIREITDNDKEKILSEANKMSDEALRVLGVAYKEQDSFEMESNLIFIGLVAMIDPPRLEVKDSIKKCKDSGIITVMITGDHPNTALAIAKDLGIAEDESQVMIGSELDKLTDDELKDKVKNLRVFARVSPIHKVRIVTAFKANGNICSMTGDGVNDAPSLKAADIGVAMGITGTDVAKSASKMILMDDNFSTIVEAVEQGRIIYDNIKKSIIFLLSCNIGEIVTLFFAVLLNWPIPLLASHLLWINLITDTFPALSLGVDTGDVDIMKRKPRDPKESLFKGRIFFIVSNGFLIGLITLLSFGIGVLRHSPDIDSLYELITHIASSGFESAHINALEYGRTMAFVTIAVSQLLHSFNLRSETKSIFTVGLFTNKYLVYSLIAGILIQLIVVYTPLSISFKVVAIAPKEWIISLGLGLIPIIYNELYKIILRSK